jgi:hypothetical protein
LLLESSPSSFSEIACQLFRPYHEPFSFLALSVGGTGSWLDWPPHGSRKHESNGSERWYILRAQKPVRLYLSGLCVESDSCQHLLNVVDLLESRLSGHQSKR